MTQEKTNTWHRAIQHRLQEAVEEQQNRVICKHQESSEKAAADDDEAFWAAAAQATAEAEREAGLDTYRFSGNKHKKDEPEKKKRKFIKEKDNDKKADHEPEKEKRQFLNEQIKKYCVLMSFREAEIYYRLPTQKWIDDNAKHLQKKACERGELYALFGGTHTRKGKSVTPINTEQERSLFLEYFPTIEDFNKYMKFNDYHLHSNKIKKPVPDGWMKKKVKSKTVDRKSSEYPKFRRYGDKAGKEILFLR